MREVRRYHHISSAVVMVLPDHIAGTIAAIAKMDGAEIHAHENGRIIVVMEGASAGELGNLLTAIGNLEGVIAANMVFEHVEELRGAGS